jgi:phage terminase small subunit
LTGSKGLTIPQRKFVRAFAKGMGQTDAARVAGYANPEDDGHNLLALPNVMTAIQGLMDKHLAGLCALAQRRLEEILKGPAITKDDKTVIVQASKAVSSRADQRAKQTRDSPADQAKALQSLDVPGLMALVKEMEGRYIDVTPDAPAK